MNFKYQHNNTAISTITKKPKAAIMNVGMRLQSCGYGYENYDL